MFIKPALGLAVAVLAVASMVEYQSPRKFENLEQPVIGADLPYARSVLDEAYEQMLAFDTNEDGVLTASELTDPRLTHLLAAADFDADGIVHAEDLYRHLSQRARRNSLDQAELLQRTSRGMPREDEQQRRLLAEQSERYRRHRSQALSVLLSGEAVDSLGLSWDQRIALSEAERDFAARVDGLLTLSQIEKLENRVKQLANDGSQSAETVDEPTLRPTIVRPRREPRHGRDWSRFRQGSEANEPAG